MTVNRFHNLMPGRVPAKKLDKIIEMTSLRSVNSKKALHRYFVAGYSGREAAALAGMLYHNFKRDRRIIEKIGSQFEELKQIEKETGLC